MRKELRKTYLEVQLKLMELYSENTVLTALPITLQEDTLLKVKDLLEKELSEKEFLKELSILEEIDLQEK